MKAAQDRQKSYGDMKRQDLEIEIGEKVLLKVSPTKGMKRFGRKGKLSPRNIGPQEVLQRIGEVTYRLALSMKLGNVHNVFQVSQLRRYVHDLNHILQPRAIALDQKPYL
ncbi:uncharacterized protein LOC104906148 [Beta vulgaris subsp. vulgaris]|uniref:uncharacterized protein LOC104906148 n=1 Tax=Beta vulgaris subsp. vulgaris TaxID=3555 RepID=UPI00053F2C7E|nr:uncharacterized protein LOC104906148 [Beta vulgaris subsp. vulgaris]